MRDVLRTLALVGLAGAIGCGGDGASPGTGGQGAVGTGNAGAAAGAPGSGGAPSAGSGGVPGGGGAGPGGAGGASPAAFHLSGTLASLLTAPLPLGEGYAALDPSSCTVTHVMAVNPSSQDLHRTLAPVGTDGSFSIDLEPGHPWVLVFLDSSQVGSDMICGIFRASELDTLAPAEPGATDLGMVTMMGGHATVGIAYADLLAALHLSSSAADLLGASDDVCLRYVNPDLDGDGVIDLQQSDHNFSLDFHVQFAMRSADPSSSVGATIADIAAGFLPDDTAILYGGVGVYATFTDAFAGYDPTMAWVAFDSASTYYPGGGGPGGPVTVSAGTHITGNDLTYMGMTGSPYHSQGISAAAGHDLPQGKYQFGMQGHTLTFTNVRTHTDAELSAAADFIMPFVHLVTAADCTGDCPVSSVDFKWMRRSSAGWVPATLEELSLIVNPQGGYVSVVKDYDNGNKHLGLTIPSTVQSGSVSWSSANLDGLTADEAAATKVSEVCHFGLSYDDKLGMRMFSGIGNTPGTCPMM